jgi:hypothetical protein
MTVARFVVIFIVFCLPHFATTIRIIDEPEFVGPKPPYGDAPYTVDNPTANPAPGDEDFQTVVGQLIVRIDGTTNVIMYCIDLLTGIDLGVTYDSVPRFPNPGAEQRVAWLYNHYGFFQLGVPASVNTDDEAVALQLAMWDILHDGGTGPNAGNFVFLGDAFPNTAALWQNYLTLSAGQQSAAAFIYVNYTQGANPEEVQTLIGPGQVPEPSTWAMVLAGGAALAGLRRRSNRRAA